MEYNNNFKRAIKKPVDIEWMTFEDAVLCNLLKLDAIDGQYYMDTLEGVVLVTPNDVIIKGVKDELYPCKKEIFYATYDFEKEV